MKRGKGDIRERDGEGVLKKKREYKQRKKERGGWDVKERR